MTFRSILFVNPEDHQQTGVREAPDFFVDLNLDQVVDTITKGKQEYDLTRFYYTPLRDLDAIAYRHEIWRDLEHAQVYECVRSFARKMRAMREQLVQADKLHYAYQKERWFVDAVETYCEAVAGLLHDMTHIEVQSHGFLALRDYVMEYASSDYFTSLEAETQQLKAELAAVRYCLLIRGSSIKVRAYEDESDYSVEVEETFAKFKQGAVKDYRVKFHNWPDMDHVEARILMLVARLFPDTFSRLDNYCAKHSQYQDQTLVDFDREIQFYVAYLDYIEMLKWAGLPFCYPVMSATSKEVYDYEGFDIALASKLVSEKSSVVCNDFSLKGKERILVVTGPNQGGKTTFARAFGQLHYLASLGCPVPGRQAQLFLCDRLFTHFEKEETIADLRGKLQDDLVRIAHILSQASSDSIIIMNEIFTSTTLNDALFLSKNILEKIIQLDALGVCVTFIDELTSLSEQTVSMVSTVVPDNPAVRTYKIVRKAADGLAHALAIAEKYRLTYHLIKERLAA
jgi:DNA mismatch repair protein MutS